MLIIQYIPNCVEIDIPPKRATFNTLQELWEIDFVKSWRESTWRNKQEFFRYSLNDNLLMVEYNDGDSWYVIGRIDNPASLDLPRPKYVEDRNKI